MPTLDPYNATTADLVYDYALRHADELLTTVGGALELTDAALKRVADEFGLTLELVAGRYYDDVLGGLVAATEG